MVDKDTNIGILIVMVKYDVRLLEDAVHFLRGLPAKLRAKAFRAIELLRDLGPELPMPHARALKGTDGLKELRVKLASDIVRLFYFHYQGKVYVVTSGFIKKSDRTDPRELQRAIRLMKAFKDDTP
jgi:phage-related protein